MKTDNLKRIILCGFFLILSPREIYAALGDLSQTFTLEGELYNSSSGTTPFIGEAEIQVRILDPGKTCVLYAESQIIDTTLSNGIFNLEIGSTVADPDNKRIALSDAGNSMANVFQNLIPITGTGAGCGGGIYTPLVGGGDGRYLEISVTPTTTGMTDVLGPEIFLGTVPMAITSETLQGLYPSNFAILKPTTSELTQSNLEDIFSTANFPVLQSLIAGGGTTSSTTSATTSLIQGDSDANGSGKIDFKIGTTTAVQIDNLGKVGFGIPIASTPSYDLSFGGEVDRILGLERRTSANTDGKDITIQAGGATTSGTDKTGGDLYLASGIATGIGSSNIHFQTSAPGSAGTTDNIPTTKMTILGDGNVGIGTTTPSALLHLNSSLPAIMMEYPTNLYGQHTFRSNSIERWAFGANGPACNGVSCSSTDEENGFWVFQANNKAGASVASYRLFINDSGDVGIGTTSPAALLHIASDINGRLVVQGDSPTQPPSIDISRSHGTQVAPSPTLTSDGLGYLNFRGYTSSYLSGAAIGAVSTADWTSTNRGATDMQFFTTSTGGIPTEKMRINSSGNVGIGTTSPSYKLDVSESVNPVARLARTDANDNNNQGLILSRSRSDATAPASGFGTGLAFSLEGFTDGSATTAGLLASVWDSAQTDDTTSRDSSLRFSTQLDGALTEKMRINSAGTVGIGTTSPAVELHVHDGAGATTDFKLSNNSSGITSSDGFTVRFSGTNASFKNYEAGDLIFETNATEKMRILSGGEVGIGIINPSEKLHVVGNILASGTITASSDLRLKKNITPIENSLEKISRITGVEYIWKNPNKHSTGRQIGVIAQDVEKVFPEAVLTDKAGFKSVSYMTLVAPLINAVKELKDENRLLKERLERIEKNMAEAKSSKP